MAKALFHVTEALFHIAEALFHMVHSDFQSAHADLQFARKCNWSSPCSLPAEVEGEGECVHALPASCVRRGAMDGQERRAPM